MKISGAQVRAVYIGIAQARLDQDSSTHIGRAHTSTNQHGFRQQRELDVSAAKGRAFKVGA
jgi:hypothetical protein